MLYARTLAQRQLWATVSSVLEGGPAACGVTWVTKDAIELPTTGEVESDVEDSSDEDSDDDDDDDDDDEDDDEDDDDDEDKKGDEKRT